MQVVRWRFGRAWPVLMVAAMLLGAEALMNGRLVSATDSKKPGAVAVQGGPLPTPLPLLPVDNWWNVDVSNAPVDVNSANFITFIGGAGRSVHPDFGGIDTDNPPHGIYGIPYVVVDSTQPKKAVVFDFSDESDGVDHNTDTSFPFYPIPDEAITQGHWIEGGPPGNQNVGGDRHMLIVDKDNKHLYELYDLFYNGSQWTAGSGAFFDMKTNNRRPETWTSADAAGLAILPGLVRYDEVYGPDPIQHAFRVTVQATNGYVFPASHAAGTNPSALPMGARLRLKPGKTITGPSATPQMLKIVAALKKYGLIVADNGSNMYISGAFDTRWDNGILNPALAQLKASDFEVIRRGFNPPVVSINDVSVTEGDSGTKLATFTISLSASAVDPVGLTWATANNTATAGSDYVANNGSLSFTAGQQTKEVSVIVNGDAVFEGNEIFFVNLSAATNATIVDAQGVGTITNDDAQAPVVVTGAASNITDSTVTLNATANANGAATTGSYQYGLTVAYGSTTTSESLGSGIAATPFQSAVAGLACNTQYHFRAVATNVGGTTNGLDNTFTTAACPPPPTVATNAVTEITQTGATLNGNVNPNGGATDRRFQYGPTLAYGSTSPDLAIGNGNSGVAVSFVATGLACNTLYNYRAVGQNSGGTTNGGNLTFTTAACPPPGSNNISALTAITVSANSTTADTLSNVRAEIWFRARLFASRSYQFSVWPVNHEQGSDAPAMSLAIFSDDAGVTPATPTPTVTSGVLEGTPNSHGDALPNTLVFEPSTTGLYKIRVLRTSGGAVSHSINFALRETTLFSPWTSRAAGFEGFIEMHNNTNAPVNVTLRGYNNAGALQGAGVTLTIPANATEFRTAGQIGVPVEIFAGIVLTHNGALGAISGNITTLNGANGLSFDSPFTPRDGGWQGLPVR